HHPGPASAIRFIATASKPLGCGTLRRHRGLQPARLYEDDNPCQVGSIQGTARVVASGPRHSEEPAATTAADRGEGTEQRSRVVWISGCGPVSRLALLRRLHPRCQVLLARLIFFTAFAAADGRLPCGGLRRNRLSNGL